MITTKTLFSVTCNKCGITLPTNAESARIALDEAKSLGWKTAIRSLVGEVHYCPHCANEKSQKEYYGG